MRISHLLFVVVFLFIFSLQVSLIHPQKNEHKHIFGGTSWNFCRPILKQHIETGAINFYLLTINVSIFIVGCSFDSTSLTMPAFLENIPPDSMENSPHVTQPTLSEKWNLVSFKALLQDHNKEIMFSCRVKQPDSSRLVYSLSLIECFPNNEHDFSMVPGLLSPKILFFNENQDLISSVNLCKREPRKMGVAICTAFAPMAGPIWKEEIRQFIEYHKHIGIDHFYIYEHTSKHVQFFQTNYPSLVTSVKWRPTSSDPNSTIFVFRKSGKVNIPRESYDMKIAHTHCIHNSEYKWVVNIDLDEFLWIDNPLLKALEYFESEIGNSSALMLPTTLMFRTNYAYKNHNIFKENLISCPRNLKLTQLPYAKLASIADDLFYFENHNGSFKHGSKQATGATDLHFKNLFVDRVAPHAGCLIETRYYRRFRQMEVMKKKPS